MHRAEVIAREPLPDGGERLTVRCGATRWVMVLTPDGDACQVSISPAMPIRYQPEALHRGLGYVERVVNGRG